MSFHRVQELQRNHLIAYRNATARSRQSEPRSMNGVEEMLLDDCWGESSLLESLVTLIRR